MKYTNVERPQNFVPLGSDYKRFVALQESKRIKKIPEAGATVSKEKPEVKRLQERMEQSFGDTKPKPQESKKVPIKVKESPKVKIKEKEDVSPRVEQSKKQPRRLTHVYEKAGKPSGWQETRQRTGQESKAQLESRKKMMKRMNFGAKR
jgi:hypothetical protein